MASQVKFPEAAEKRPAFMDEGLPAETSSQKLWRKLRDQPLVPLGCLATCGALVAASYYLRTGNREQFQKALRWRVGLQGLTVVAAVAGTLYLGSGTPADSSRQSVEGIATSPGRPATVSQAVKQDERREFERAQLFERLREAEQREEAEQKQRAEAVLLRTNGKGTSEGAPAWLPSDAQRVKPTIGLDRRDRTGAAATKADVRPEIIQPEPEQAPQQAPPKKSWW